MKAGARTLVVVMLLSCAAPGRGRKAPAGPPPATLPGAGPAQSPVPGFHSWARLNARRFRSRGHGYVWVDAFVDPAFLDAYRARAAPAPVGLRVAMLGYDAEKGPPVGLTVMVKMPPGYDASGGDWYYAALDPDGRVASTQGRVAPCRDCHRHAQGDHLFGVEPAGDLP